MFMDQGSTVEIVIMDGLRSMKTIIIKKVAGVNQTEYILQEA